MRYASVIHEGRALAVEVRDGMAVPLRGLTELGRATPLSALAAAPREEHAALPLEEVGFRPVVPDPDKVICVGLNYAAHAEEAQRDVESYPVLFTKFASSLCGAFEEIPCPPESRAVDYEGELAVVIGEAGRRIARERALKHVAGVSVANDVTMRDYQGRTHQWLQGKAWDRSTPVGPELVTLDEAGDLGALRLRTEVNGEVVQDASTAQMLFDVPTLVAAVSEFAALKPGDLILTGTPSGVGYRREPRLLLGDGDVVAVSVEGVGRVENRFAAQARAR